MRPSADWGELSDFVAFEETRRARVEPQRCDSATRLAPAATVGHAHLRGNGPARLFEFQSAGVEWLSRRRRGILADEQGLGKTVQALLAWWRHRQHTALVVVTPLSVLPYWAAACRDWLGVDPVHEGALGTCLPLHVAGVTLTTWERLPGRALLNTVPAYTLVGRRGAQGEIQERPPHEGDPRVGAGGRYLLGPDRHADSVP